MAARKIGPAASPAPALPLHIYRMIADAIPHMLWTARPDGTLDYLNARITHYTGLTVQQLRAGDWTSVLHPDDRELCVARWKRALSSGRGYEAEYRLRRADGVYHWHFHSVLALHDHGRIALWCGTCTDVEEHKNAVRLLEQARQTLESLIMSRTQMLGGEAAAVPGIDLLSDRERQVLQLIVDGHTSAEVGERLGLSPKSIDTYRSRLMSKLGIDDLPALVKFAIRHGLTTLG
jgi:PAS domain S-box-containing protein